jgi:hypothetical protein
VNDMMADDPLFQEYAWSEDRWATIESEVS